MKLLEVQIDFFVPLRRRVALVAFCFVWSLVEFNNGMMFWGMVFVAIGTYSLWQFFFDGWPARHVVSEEALEGQGVNEDVMSDRKESDQVVDEQVVDDQVEYDQVADEHSSDNHVAMDRSTEASSLNSSDELNSGRSSSTVATSVKEAANTSDTGSTSNAGSTTIATEIADNK